MAVRQAYAHEAVLDFAPDGDEREPGAVVTTGLCGDVEHKPPCPVAPHYVEAVREGTDRLRLRVLFAVAAHRQDEVRDRIDDALRARWTLVSSGCVRLAPEEKDHARKLVKTPREESPGQA